MRRRYGRAIATVTRQIGECQICQHTQKLDGGRLVLHGYRRPGEGHVYGECPGVGQLPYEVSCDAIKDYKTRLEARLPDLEKELAGIEGGRVSKFVDSKGMELVPGDPRFAGALQRLKWDVEKRIRDTKSEIRRSEKRIAEWAPKPIRTVEEMEREADTAKAARKADREAARAARAEKKAVNAAKQEALKVRRNEIAQGLVAQLTALAAQPPSPERDAAVQKFWTALVHSKKYEWLWMYQFFAMGGAAPALALGLAHRSPEGHVLVGRP